MTSNVEPIFFVLGGYLFGMIFLCVGYHLREKICRLKVSGLVARGKVVALEVSGSFSSEDKALHPVFAFRDMEGIEHRVRSAVGSYPASHKVGDVVRVFYLAHSPHQAIIDPKNYTLASLIFLLAGLAAIAIGTISAISIIVGRRP
jgi:hypothetical protein